MEIETKKKFLYWLCWWGAFFLYLVVLGSLLAVTADNETIQIIVGILGILLTVPLIYKIYKSKYVFRDALLGSKLDIKGQTKTPVFIISVGIFLVIIGISIYRLYL